MFQAIVGFAPLVALVLVLTFALAFKFSDGPTRPARTGRRLGFTANRGWFSPATEKGPTQSLMLRKLHGIAAMVWKLASMVLLPMTAKRNAVTAGRFALAFGIAAMVAIAAPLVKGLAVLPGVFGVTTASERLELEFSENNIRDVKVDRGRLLDSVVLNLPWTSTVTADATSVRTRGAPIKTIQFLGDGGKVHLSIKLQDAIRKAEIYGRASLTQILTSPSGVTAAGSPYTGRIKLPIYLASRHAYTPWLTALASWRLTKDPTVRVQWGSHAEVYVGGTGTTALTASDTAFIEKVSMVDWSDIVPEVFKANIDGFGDSLPLAIDTFEEKTYTAAQERLTFDLPVTMDYRAIMITGEDTNGTPLTEAEMAKISFTLKENGSVDVDSEVNLASLRVRNSEQFNTFGAFPPGCAIREWAEDKDITAIYAASEKNKVQMIFKTATPAAGTYTLRVHVIGMELKTAKAA